MPKMFNVKSREWRDIPEGDVQAAFESRQYVFAKGASIPVAMEDGRYGTISGDKFGAVIRAGGSYDIPSERQERADEESYDSRNAEALLLAAGRGLTFGLSDVALEKMGAYSDEEIQKLEKHNAILSGVGEVAGALAPAVFTGGGSALGAAGIKGLLKKGLHYSPQGFATRSAAAAEAAIGRKFGVEALEGGSKMLRAVPGIAAAGAIEGALFGAGETFSEELLGRTDKTAQQIAGDVGYAALLGGTLTGVFSMAPAAVAKAFQSQAKTEYPKGLAKIVGDFKDKYTAAMTGMDEGMLAKTREPGFLDDLLNFDEVEKKVAVAARETIGDLFGAVEGTTRGVTEAKNKVFLPKVKAAVETDTINGTLDALQFYIKDLGKAADTLGHKTQRTAAHRLIKQAHKVQEGIARSIQDKLKAAGYKQFKVKVVRGKKSNPDYGTIQIIKKGKPRPGKFTADGLPEKVPDTVYTMGQVEGFLNKAPKPGSLGGLARQIFKEVDSLKMGQSRLDSGMAGYAKLSGLLETEDFFGEAAKMQTQLNSAWKPLIEQQKEFASQFMKKHKGTKRLEPDGKKIKSFLNNLRNEDTSEYARSQVFDAYVEAFDTYSKTAKGIGLELGGAAPTMITGSKAMRESWTEFKYLQAAKKEIGELTRNPGLVSETFATIGGYAFGGLPGALAARWVRNIATPGDAVRRRVVAHGIKSRVSKTIDGWAENSAKRLMGNIKGALAVKPFDTLTGAKRVSLLGLIGAKATGNEEEDTQKEIEAFATISSPEVIAQKVRENTKMLHDAPEISAEIDQGAIRATQIYGGVIKDNVTLSIDSLTGEQQISVSDAARAKITRTRNVCYGPACAQLASEVSQNALTDATVAQSFEVFPVPTQQFVTKFGEDVVKEWKRTGTPPSLQLRQIWGKMNGSPFSTMPASSARALQASAKIAPGEQDQQRPSNRAAASLKDVANRAVTPVTASMET